MSTPTGTNSVNEPSASATPPASPPEPLDVTRAVWQLRVLACWLGLGLLIVSLVLNAFIWKQNRNLVADTAFRNQQAMQVEKTQQRLSPLLEELAGYSLGNPELIAVFKRFGLDIKSPPATGAPPPSAPAP